MAKQNRKHLVLLDLLKHCQKNNNFTFNNNLIKEICVKYNIRNQFDVTKLDSADKLPQFFKEQDICLLHLGNGNHKFIKGINKLYHKFEPIQKSVRWEYKKSLLNQFLYYHNSNLPIKEIICVYLVWQKDKQKIKLWAYTFDNPLRLDSIKFIKSKEYILIRK